MYASLSLELFMHALLVLFMFTWQKHLEKKTKKLSLQSANFSILLFQL